MAGWLRILLLTCLLSALPARALQIDTAHYSYIRDGVVQSGETALPYPWDRTQGNRSGAAELGMQFQLNGEPQALYGLYFAHIGNRAEIWLNGDLLSRLGMVGTGSQEDYVKAPRLFLMPGELLVGNNVLRVVLEADGSRRGGLSAPLIGPADEMQAIYQREYFWRVTVSVIVAVFSLIVGVTALLLWLTQRGHSLARSDVRNGLYLSAGFAELFWVVRVLDQALEQTPLPWPWWTVVQTFAFAGWVSGVVLFCQHVAGWERDASMRWVRGSAAFLVLTAAPAAFVAQFWQQKLYLTVWFGLIMLLTGGYLIYYFVQTLRNWSAQQAMVVIAGLANVGVGVRDWLVIRLQYNFEETNWQRYSSTLFGLTLLYVVIVRFHRTRTQARDLMDNMAARVQQKEQELAVSYRQLEQLAREQERAAERTRILRDMHDGVGSHISAAIRQLQSGKASEEELLQTLRDSLDQLKLSIDAMNLPPGDITTLLANLRYRLEPRFKASDIALVWDVDLIAPLPQLDAKAMRQLQFMVFEALSNVLQHAQASELRIELRGCEGGGAQLRVIDNGRGFDVQRVQRKGLASLRERAAAIGAQLNVSSVPGYTAVEISLG
jgi:signal transduction histidine kinase